MLGFTDRAHLELGLLSHWNRLRCYIHPTNVVKNKIDIVAGFPSFY